MGGVPEEQEEGAVQETDDSTPWTQMLEHTTEETDDSTPWTEMLEHTTEETDNPGRKFRTS